MADFTSLNGYNVKDSVARSGLDTLNTKVDALGTRKVIFVGDSYIKGYSNVGETYTSFAEIMKANLPFESTVLGRSGAGFCNVGDENENFLQVLQEFDGDKDEITEIYVYGGFNDWQYAPSAIKLAIGNFVSYVNSNYSKAKVYIGFIARCTNMASYANALTQTLRAYIDGCGLTGATYIVGAENILKNNLHITADTLHPNQYGHNHLANYLIGNVLTGLPITINTKTEMRPTENNGVQFPDIEINQIDGLCNVAWHDTSILDLSAFGATTWKDTWLDVGVLDNNCVIVGYKNIVNGCGVLQYANDFLTTCAYSLRIINKHIYLKIFALKGDGSVFSTFALKNFYLPPNAFTFNLNDN